MVTVVTIKMRQGAVSKTPSPSSQPSQCLSSPAEKSADFEAVGRRVLRRSRAVHAADLQSGDHLQTTAEAFAGAASPHPLGEPTILCSRRMKVS